MRTGLAQIRPRADEPVSALVVGADIAASPDWAVTRTHDLAAAHGGPFDVVLLGDPPATSDWPQVTAALNRLGLLLRPGGLLGVTIDDRVRSRLLVRRLPEAFDRAETEPHAAGDRLWWRRRDCRVVITSDYEIYEPPHARAIRADPAIWEREVLGPTARMLTLLERHGAKLTIMAELCQLWLLERANPELAETVRRQLVDAVERGHDVQLHYHPRWLDSAGAYGDAQRRRLVRGRSDRLHTLAGVDLAQLFARGRGYLEALLRPVDATYRTIAFRAGKYQIQPHAAVFRALAKAGFVADSSVWLGGHLPDYEGDFGFDFRTAWHPFLPYVPRQDDLRLPGLEAADDGVIELPIYAGRGASFSFDAPDATQNIALYRKVQGFGGPRIMIGHSKIFAAGQENALQELLEAIGDDPALRFVTLAEETQHARAWLENEAVRRDLGALQALRQRCLGEALIAAPSTAARTAALTEALGLDRRKGPVRLHAVGSAGVEGSKLAAALLAPAAQVACADDASERHLAALLGERTPAPVAAPDLVLIDAVSTEELVAALAQAPPVPIAVAVPVRRRNYKRLLAALAARMPHALIRLLIGASAVLRRRGAAPAAAGDPTDPRRAPVDTLATGVAAEPPDRRRATAALAAAGFRIVGHVALPGATAGDMLVLAEPVPDRR